VIRLEDDLSELAYADPFQLRRDAASLGHALQPPGAPAILV
jgi:hypothetical protein